MGCYRTALYSVGQSTVHGQQAWCQVSVLWQALEVLTGYLYLQLLLATAHYTGGQQKREDSSIAAVAHSLLGVITFLSPGRSPSLSKSLSHYSL